MIYGILANGRQIWTRRRRISRLSKNPILCESMRDSLFPHKSSAKKN